MANDDLPQILEQLHIELSQSPQLDAQTLLSLRALMEEIEATIARSGAEKSGAAENPPPLSINQRLQELITDFEVRHPKLTSTLSQIADRLSDMGI